MSETTVKQPVSLGKVEKIQINNQAQSEKQKIEDSNNSNDVNIDTKNNSANGDTNLIAPPIELNEEQVSKYLESQGITGFKNLEELKSKLSVPAAAIPPTEDEKQKAIADLEKRQLDLFLLNKGTVEQFASIKNILALESLKDLGITEIRKEMREAKFNDEEIEAVLQERYYQENPDELEQEIDESTADFEKRKADFKKKHEFAASKIEKRGQNIKKNAESILKNLRTAIEQSDLSKMAAEENERKLASTTDEHLSKVPKEITYELGKAPDEADIAPVLHRVDDADISEVALFLKDKTKRETKFITPEGDLNVTAIADLLLENATLKKGLKAAYLSGGSRQVDHFRKVFPAYSAQQIGIGNNGVKNISTNGEKRLPVSMGKVQKSYAGRQ
jgi:hypothetical protein